MNLCVFMDTVFEWLGLRRVYSCVFLRTRVFFVFIVCICARECFFFYVCLSLSVYAEFRIAWGILYKLHLYNKSSKLL